MSIIGQYFLIAFLSLLSHVILDILAKMTYHPPEPQWDDKFWIIYHSGVYLSALIILILWISPYWWALMWGIMPDLWDWGIFRYVIKKKPIFHPIIDKIKKKAFKWLPDWTSKKYTVIGEWVFNIGLFIVLFINV
jgi:hypothetical protein